MTSQPISFWLLCLYLFFEYVRPQDIYEPLLGRPIPFWTIVACACAYVLEGAKSRRWLATDTWIAVFTAVVLASSIQAWNPNHAFSQFALFGSWFAVYLLISTIVNSERRFFAFLFLYLLYNVKMTQHGVRGWAETGFGFRTWGVSCAPSWFQNSGECGIQMGMLFALSLVFLLAVRTFWSRVRFWLFMGLLPGGAVITIVASSSRGAVLALAAIGIWFLLRSKQRIRSLIAVAVVAVAVTYIVPEEQKVRFQEMGDDGTSTMRITYWKDGLRILNENPALGIGYRNWLPYYRRAFDPRGELPHNIFIEAGAELGYIGVLAFMALIGATWVTNYRTRKRLRGVPTAEARILTAAAHGFDGALIAFLVAGFFVTVLYYPFFWVNLAFTAALSNVAMTHCSTTAENRVDLTRLARPSPAANSSHRVG